MDVLLKTSEGEEVVVSVDAEERTLTVEKSPHMSMFRNLLTWSVNHASGGDGQWPASVLLRFARDNGLEIVSELPELGEGVPGREY